MLTIVRNRTWAFDATIFDTYVKDGDPGNVPTNHTGWTIRSQIRTRVGNKLVANLNVTFPVPASGTVAIRHERDFTRSLATGDYWWDIVATDAAGDDYVYVEPEPIAVRDNPTDPANSTYDFVPGGGGAVMHTHVIADVTGLQAALNGKQPLDADLTSWAGVTRAAGFDTFSTTPSSTNLRALVTDETGTGALVFATGPTFAGLTNTGALNLATGTTFVYGTGIASAHRTALGLGTGDSPTFSGLTVTGPSYFQDGGFTTVETTSLFFDAYEASNGATFTYNGTGASDHRIALGLGTTDAPTFGNATFSTGSIATSQPLTLTQTWTNAATTYTGLKVNITDSGPSNAASLLMDLQVGGVRKLKIDKAGAIYPAGSNTNRITGDTVQIYFGNASQNFQSFRATNFVNAANVAFAWCDIDNSASSGTVGLFLFRDANNTLAQRNGTAAQESRIYGTYTSATNHERLSLKYNATDTAFQIGTEKGSAGGVAQPLQFRTDSTTRMAITTTGNVGIGTTSPASKLDVVGGITASGTVTANSGLVVTSTSYPVLDVTRSAAATGDFRAATRFKRENSSGTTSAGMGVGCFFEIPNAANNLKNVGFFGGAIATATAGAEVGELVFAPAWLGVDPYLRRDMVLRATSAATADLSLTGNLTASGLITDTQPTDAATPVNAFTAATLTEAGLNAQKWSPVIKQSAKGWGTTAGTSQDVSFSTIVKPTQSTVPTGTWSLQSSIAGGALTDQLTVSSTGVTSSAVSFSAPIYYGTNSSGGILRLDGNAATRGLGIGSLNLVAWSSGAYSGGSVSGDTNLNRSAAGIVQIGTTSANALGSLACFNGTFGGDVGIFSLTVTGGTVFGEESLVQFDALAYYYGTGAASAHRIALGAGTTGATLFGAATAAEARTTLGITRKKRTATANKSSDTTFAADLQITAIPVVANTSYRARLVLFATLGAGGLKAKLSLPSIIAPASTASGRVGTRVFWGQSFATPITSDSASNSISLIATNDTASTNQYVGDFEFRVGATGGNAVFEWAQNSSNATNSSLLEGSYLELEEI